MGKGNYDSANKIFDSVLVLLDLNSNKVRSDDYVYTELIANINREYLHKYVNYTRIIGM